MDSKDLTTVLSLPTERSDMYPESDGKPMAETDVHRDLMADFIEMLKNHFKDCLDAYVSGNLLLYYEKGDPKRSVAPDVFVAFGIEKKLRRTYLLWEEADYSSSHNKAKVHLGFDLNRGHQEKVQAH